MTVSRRPSRSRVSDVVSDEDSARAEAYRWLAAAPRSASELDARLRARGFDDALVTATIAFLAARGYVDDAALAHRRAEELLLRRGYGTGRVRHELTLRGVADTVIEVWTCTVNDKKTTDDVQAQNSIWLGLVHANVSEEIASNVVTSIVGDTTSFLFVDIYPDLATWERTKTYLRDNEEVESLFEDVSECSQNSLHNSEPTE